VIGGADAAGGLGYRSSGQAANVVFVVTFLATLIAAGVLAASVRSGSRRDLTCSVLAIGATYAAVVAGHHGGPLTAAPVGLGLLALAHLSWQETRMVQRLTTGPTAWTWRVALAVTVACAALDAVVALVSGGGRPRPGSPSTWSLVAGCAVVIAVAAGVTALADGARPPARRARTRDVSLTLEQ